MSENKIRDLKNAVNVLEDLTDVPDIPGCTACMKQTCDMIQLLLEKVKLDLEDE